MIDRLRFCNPLSILQHLMASILLATLLVIAPDGGTMAAGSTVESLSGVTAGAGVECPLFLLPDGEMITLSGNMPSAEGTLILTGRWARASGCMQGRTFHIETWTILSAREKNNGDSD